MAPVSSAMDSVDGSFSSHVERSRVHFPKLSLIHYELLPHTNDNTFSAVYPLSTVEPTPSTTREILPAWKNTGCPEEYVTNKDYDAGEVVSAYGSRVFECKPWPDQGFCKLFSPEDEVNGHYAWTLIGGCGGTSECWLLSF